MANRKQQEWWNKSIENEMYTKRHSMKVKQPLNVLNKYKDHKKTKQTENVFLEY